ncbi:AMP-binding protein [Saccharothrix sp. NRRL B-16348]|uniref:AMP-binding protein n=1 Tax=Saccharothrix sp. NRRL B-16348 TaxID=1415542 RepID=UPI0009E695A6|nr:AMP-binding protein [Saccharothrix sp. NRRL B-16348]
MRTTAEHRVLSALSGEPISTVRTATSPTRLSDVLDLAAGDSAGVTTIDSDGSRRRETWLSFRGRVRRIAEDIRASGIGRGRIAVVAATEPSEILALFWAGVVAGVEPLLVAEELLDERGGDGEWLAALSHQAPVHALLHAGDAQFPVVAAAARWGLTPVALDLGPGDGRDGPDRADDGPDSRIHFMTSGSTGAPKVVPQRHRGIIDMALGAVAVNGLDSATVGFNWMPLSHVGGMLMAHVRDAVIAAEHISAAPARVLADPGEWFRLVSEHRVSAVWSPNFAYRMLASAAEQIPADGRIDLSSIRFCLNGGEAVSAKDCARFERSLGRLGMPRGTFAPAWGMAETCSGVLYSPRYDPASDTSPTVSVGFPLPGVEVRIVAAADVEEDGVGHLEVRGSMVLERYLVGGDLAKSTDGWFRTGDLARIADDGVHFVGRDGTRIVANGVTWNSADLESEAEQVDGVVPGTCAVTSFRPRGAERDSVAVFCAVDGNASEVRAEVGRRLEKIIGVPVAQVVDVPPSAIERTSIGKVRKGRLVRRFIDPAPRQLWTLDWVPTASPGAPRLGGAGQPPVVLRGAGLAHSAVAEHTPGELHDVLQRWRREVEPARLRGRDVCVVIETYEANSDRLPRSHPVAAFLRATAHGAGARSVRTIWVHPAVDEQALDGVLGGEHTPDADLFLGPHGDLWRRVRTPVAIDRSGPRADHFVILGGTGRLGEALGAELALRGARVTLVGSRTQPGEDRGDGISRVTADITSSAAVRGLVRTAGWDPRERTQVVHLAGAPTPAPQDVVERLIGPKTDGVREAAGLAHALDAHLAVVSSVNAHVAGTGVETYAAACAAAETTAERVALVPTTVVSVTSVSEARQTDRTTVALGEALGLDEVSVMDIATCLLAEPARSVLLGVGEHMPLIPPRDSEPTPPPDTGPTSATGPAEPELSPTAAHLAKALRPLLGADSARLDTSWFHMGLTSADLPNFARTVTQHTGQKVGVLELMRYPTLAELADYVEGSRKRSSE